MVCTDPYKLELNAYIVKRQLKRSMEFVIVRRTLLERFINSVYKDTIRYHLVSELVVR